MKTFMEYTSKAILFFFIVQLQKEMFLSREELQMSIRGAEDKEMEKQVFA